MALPLSSIPALNATLNAISAGFLSAGYFFIRRKRIAAHRFCMVSAFICSVVFLAFYLYFHFHAGIIRFGGEGLIRPVYFTLLISHTILAGLVPVLAIVTLTLALRKNFLAHRRIARWTLPIWLYVSVTGVVIYWLLYLAYTPIGAPS
jgi:uncharacterized membrane protein YozB (DUF420 family)